MQRMLQFPGRDLVAFLHAELAMQSAFLQMQMHRCSSALGIACRAPMIGYLRIDGLIARRVVLLVVAMLNLVRPDIAASGVTMRGGGSVVNRGPSTRCGRGFERSRRTLELVPRMFDVPSPHVPLHRGSTAGAGKAVCAGEIPTVGDLAHLMLRYAADVPPAWTT